MCLAVFFFRITDKLLPFVEKIVYFNFREIMYEFYVFIDIFFSFSFNKLYLFTISNVTSTYYMEMK